MDTIAIRVATPDDAELLAQLIVELAQFEKLGQEAQPEVERLRQDLNPGSKNRIHALIATKDGVVAGFALYFFRYSTFLTNWGIHLEDIFVRENFRGEKIGQKLFAALGVLARSGDHRRLDLAVLDWNEGALQFYKKLGAIEITDWTSMRFEGEALKKL